MNTGLVDAGFNPDFAGGGEAEAVEATPDGTRLYITGGFNTHQRGHQRGLARLEPDHRYTCLWLRRRP